MLGPVDYIAVGFVGNNFNGDILKELQKLVDSGTVRVLDLLFVTKDESGKAEVLELSDMPEAVAKAFSPFASNLDGLLTAEDVLELAADLDSNSSAGVLVYEQLWAKTLKEALIKADGVLLAEGRVHPDDVEEVISELKESKEK